MAAKTDTKTEKPAAAKPSQSAEGNCGLCGRWARLKPDGSTACCDEERCAASRARDALIASLLTENDTLRARVAQLELAAKK